MLRKFLLAALLCLGFAAIAPTATTAAPIGPAVTLSGDAAPGGVEKVQWRRRGYGRRGFYRRGFHGRRRFYGPRRFYRPRHYRRRFF